LVCLICSFICFFSFSAPVFSRGTQGRVGPARQAKGCFLRGSQETSRFGLFLGGTANPKGGIAEAEARCAASAQASFPSRRARQKTVPEKGRELFCFVRVDLQSELGHSSLYFWYQAVIP
jgi:hypothetical protein